MSNYVSMKRLGDIVNFKRGYDLPSYNRKDGNYPIVSSSGISGYHAEYKVDGEGVVTGRYGTLGEVYYVNGKYWPHNTALYVTDFKGNYPKYVYYLLKVLGNLQTSDKSTVPGINRNDLHEIIIPCADKPYQQKIAAVLSALDAKIELNQRINAELESTAKTLYDYWFVQFATPSVLRTSPPNATGDRPSNLGEVPAIAGGGGGLVWNEALKREIPLGWEVKKVRDFAETSSGGTPLSKKKEYYENGTIPWINSGELNEPFIVSSSSFITEEGLNNSSAKMFPENTVLVALYGATAGKVSLLRIEACTNQAVCALLPKSPIYTNFLKYSFGNLYDYLVALSSGSARDNLSQEIIRNITFAMPPDALLEEFNKIVNPLLDKIVTNLKESQTLTELRDWLLPMLMNGQIQPPLS